MIRWYDFTDAVEVTRAERDEYVRKAIHSAAKGGPGGSHVVSTGDMTVAVWIDNNGKEAHAWDARTIRTASVDLEAAGVKCAEPHALGDMQRADYVTVNGKLMVEPDAPEGEMPKPTATCTLKGQSGSPWIADVQFDVEAYAVETLGMIPRHFGPPPGDLDVDAFAAAKSESNLADAVRAYLVVAEGKRRANYAKAAAMAELCRPVVRRRS